MSARPDVEISRATIDYYERVVPNLCRSLGVAVTLLAGATAVQLWDWVPEHWLPLYGNVVWLPVLGIGMLVNIGLQDRIQFGSPEYLASRRPRHSDGNDS